MTGLKLMVILNEVATSINFINLTMSPISTCYTRGIIIIIIIIMEAEKIQPRIRLSCMSMWLCFGR